MNTLIKYLNNYKNLHLTEVTHEHCNASPYRSILVSAVNGLGIRDSNGDVINSMSVTIKVIIKGAARGHRFSPTDTRVVYTMHVFYGKLPSIITRANITAKGLVLEDAVRFIVSNIQ